MRILFVGDMGGRPGRRAVKSLLPGLRRELEDASGRAMAIQRVDRILE